MPILIKGSGGAQKAPEISVNSSGLITATAGNKSATEQLSTQAATTITPGTSEKTAVASEKYTTGAVKVAGDADLIAENIKKGINIFGVSGLLEEGWQICCFSNYPDCSNDSIVDQLTFDLEKRYGTIVIVLNEEVSDFMFLNAVGGDEDGYIYFIMQTVPEVAELGSVDTSCFGMYRDSDDYWQPYLATDADIFADRKTIEITATSGSTNWHAENVSHVHGYFAVKK